jgi:hypothetical protein
MEHGAFQVHKGWFIRAALILIVTVLAVGTTAYFVERPILWCSLVASSLPLTMFVFVALPLLRQESRRS